MSCDAYDMNPDSPYYGELACMTPKPDGKSGNLELAIGCSYCQYKKHCYPNLRAFKYSHKPKFLCKVVKEPKVQELKLDE